MCVFAAIVIRLHSFLYLQFAFQSLIFISLTSSYISTQLLLDVPLFLSPNGIHVILIISLGGFLIICSSLSNLLTLMYPSIFSYLNKSWIPVFIHSYLFIFSCCCNWAQYCSHYFPFKLLGFYSLRFIY